MKIKAEWLGLTHQQLDILMIIYDLKINKIPIKAGNILSEYKNRFSRDLQRQNLFNQLKPLLDIGIIERREKAIYEVNKDKIKGILKNKKREFENEISNFEMFSKNIEGMFKEIITKPAKPIVTYLNPELYMETISSLLNKSNGYYADSPFPNITYTERLFKGIVREKFVLNQRNNCLVLKKLKIFYLTNLGIDLTFRRALKIFNNKGKLAYLECKKIIENLENMLNNPNLDIRYLEVLPGPHMYIFERDYPKDLILSLRGSVVPKGSIIRKSERDPYGGVHIISAEIASQAKEVYMASFNAATRLSSPKGKKIIDQVKDNLKSLYKEFKMRNR